MNALCKKRQKAGDDVASKRSSKRDLRRKCKREFRNTVLIETMVCVVTGLYLGAAYAHLPPEAMMDQVNFQPTIIDALFYLIPYVMEYPKVLFPNDLIGIGTTGMLWVVLFMMSYNKFIRRYNTMYEDAHGSGGFNEDLEEFYREYVVDPKIAGVRTEKNSEGKTVIKKRIPVEEYHGFPKGFNVLSKKKLNECLENAQIYSKDVYLSLNARWTRRNLNAFYLGASGTGKSRFAVKPNLLSANSSFVVTDPSAEILKDCGGFLKSIGYHIRVLNLKDLLQSNHYNPMRYLEKVSDIPVLTNCLISNLEGTKATAGNGDNKFWRDSTMALITACTAYQFEVFNEDNEFLEDGSLNPRYKGKRNYINVMRMIRMLEIHEDEGEAISDLDRLFAELAEKSPRSYAVKMYQTFKMAPSKTALNIVISTAVQLGTFFDNDDFANLAYKDEMDIELIGREKTAVFIITPEGETTYNFFAAMFYTQLFQVLYKQGEDNATRRGGGDPELDVPVRVFLDEMANIGTVPQFNIKLSTMRKYRISAVPIFQSLAQLKTCFKDDWEVVIGNCDTMVFLGGAEPSECEMLSKRLGKMSVKTYSYGTSKNGSSDNAQQIGREVLTADEIERMANNEQLVFIRGVRPFCTEKYTYENHPNYKYTAGSGKKQAIRFDMSSLDKVVDYEAMEQTYVYAYGMDGHVEPKQDEKFAGVPLAFDNFSIKLDRRTKVITEGLMSSWRDTVPTQDSSLLQSLDLAALVAREGLSQQSELTPSAKDVIEQIVSRAGDFHPVSAADKVEIARKIEDITKKRCVNMTEEQYVVFLNIKDAVSKEDLEAWCKENLKLQNSFTPGYEFDSETDFLLDAEQAEPEEAFDLGLYFPDYSFEMTEDKAE